MTYSSFDDLLKNSTNAFYVFDIDQLKERINYIRSQIPASIDICYAIKANTFVIKETLNSIDRLEICSPGEYEICQKLNVPLSKMVISGVYKNAEFIESLIADQKADFILTVESLSQFSLIKSFSEKYQKNIKILLRLTNGSQFGINSQDVETIISSRNEYNYIDILGIQFFSGTQKTSVKKIKREIAGIDQLLQDLKNNYGYISDEFEYGSGFPISYFEGDDLDEKELFLGFSQAVAEMKSKTKITVELGRSIVASCGKYYTHIVDIKNNKGQNYLIIDGGMHHIVYFGQYLSMKQPYLSILGKESHIKTQPWNICGALCSMNDIVAKQVGLPDVEIGDVICFENTGAYCVTEGISLFLSRDIPAVYLLSSEFGYKCVRKTIETLEINMPEY